MEKTQIYLDPHFSIAEVDRRIFGSFLEHLGRAVYQGVYQPSSKHADEDGLRIDVLKALSRLGVSIVRYPGGNFASGYHWIDGIGPKQDRPTVRELAWQSTETNQFGTDEFMRLCSKMSWRPMMTVNLGTGTPEEARNWVEYCNCPKGTKFADLRVSNGFEEPHGVKLWCLGNEMDAPWQLGHVPAEQYALRAQQAAKMMRDVDHSIELVVAGSCLPSMETYMDWDRIVLEYLGEYADYIGFHRYVGNQLNDTADYLAISNSIDKQIEEMNAVCSYVQARKRSRKRTYLCFDEWNVWYKNQVKDGSGKHAPHLLEERYNLEDALVVAGFLLSFIRHADVLKIANIAQLVNVIAPILTDGERCLVQSIYWPFAMISETAHGVALRTVSEGPSYVSPSYGDTLFVDSAAVLEGDTIRIFLINRSMDESAEIELRPTHIQIQRAKTAALLTGNDSKLENSFEKPNEIEPREMEEISVKDGAAKIEIPPLAFASITFQIS
ncbi:MAG: alpha-N-arabinofuranosidase [Spirochaetaceae bacterium]|nr:MAG: alpha-N-arabinofuranosidase [Spirochaetaceae bacterium]